MPTAPAAGLGSMLKVLEVRAGTCTWFFSAVHTIITAEAKGQPLCPLSYSCFGETSDNCMPLNSVGTQATQHM